MMMVNIKSNHQQQLLQLHHHQISSFNPACCLRPSVEEHGQRGRHGSKTKVIGPPSPRMGCMGQIKRSGSYNGSSTSSSNKKLFQFRRMFSSSGKGSAMMMVSPRATAKVEDQCCRQGISIADTMDPPLPMLKHRVVARDANVCSIWTRRRGGDGLRSLEIAQVKMQQVQHLRRSFSGMKNFDEVQA